MSQTTVEPEPPLHSDLLAEYPREGELFDEAFASGGQLRPHYARFIEEIQQLGAAELKRLLEGLIHRTA